MAYRPKSFKNALRHTNRTIANFQLTIEKNQKILKFVRRALPGALAQEAQDCVVKESKLMIFTTSAAWATQLRFYSQAIRSSVNLNCNESIDKIQLKILDSVYDSGQNPSNPKIPSKETIKNIENNQLEVADSDLKKSLINLSKTLKKLSYA